MKKLFIILLIVVIAILNYSYIYYLQHRNDYKEEKIDNIIQETKQDIILLEYEIINDPVRFVLVTYIKGEIITETMPYYKFKQILERGQHER